MALLFNSQKVMGQGNNYSNKHHVLSQGSSPLFFPNRDQSKRPSQNPVSTLYIKDAWIMGRTKCPHILPFLSKACPHTHINYLKEGDLRQVHHACCSRVLGSGPHSQIHYIRSVAQTSTVTRMDQI